MKNIDCFDCVIGLWHDYERSYTITFREIVFMDNRNDKIPLMDYFDARYGTNLERFNYCPYCGKKLDWRSMREYVKEMEDKK